MPRFFGGFVEVPNNPASALQSDHSTQIVVIYPKKKWVLVVKSTRVLGLGQGGGGGKPILAMPGFSRRLFGHSLPYAVASSTQDCFYWKKLWGEQLKNKETSLEEKINFGGIHFGQIHFGKMRTHNQTHTDRHEDSRNTLIQKFSCTATDDEGSI